MKTLKLIAIGFILLCICYSCDKDEVEKEDLALEEIENESIPKGPTDVESDSLVLDFTLETHEDQMGKFSHNQIVHFNGEFWSVGGYNSYNGDQPSSDVWKSNNGVNWVSVTSNQFPGRIKHTLTVYDNKMWVIGGSTYDSGIFRGLRDVWYSTDGITWSLVTDMAPFISAQSHAALEFNGRLFLIRYGLNETELGVTVWATTDGINWTKETSNALPNREDFNAVVFNDEIYVLSGVLHRDGVDEYYNEVYKSSNGITWTPVTTTGVPYSERAYGQAIVYDNKIWVIGGKDYTTSVGKGLWYSENGSEWQEYTDLPSNDGLSNFAATVANDRIWIFGGQHRDEVTNRFSVAGEITTIRKL